MYVRKLNLVGFRGIMLLDNPIQLSKFNVIIGRNSCGKTAILDALYIAAAPLSDLGIAPYHIPPVRLLSMVHGIIYNLIHRRSDKATLMYELATESVRRIEVRIYTDRRMETYIDGKYIADRNTFVEKLKSEGLEMYRNVPAVYLPNNSKAYDMIEGFLCRDDVIEWAGREGQNIRVVKDYISRVVYDRFTEVIPYRGNLHLRAEQPSNVIYVDVNSLGEGIKRFLLAYYAIEYLNPRLVLWDDIEVSAHPGLIEVVIDWLAKSGRQVVITTHSIDVLRAVTDVKPRDAQVIVLRKDAADVVSYTALSLDEVEESLDSGIDIRKVVDQIGKR